MPLSKTLFAPLSWPWQGMVRIKIKKKARKTKRKSRDEEPVVIDLSHTPDGPAAPPAKRFSPPTPPGHFAKHVPLRKVPAWVEDPVDCHRPPATHEEGSGDG